MNQSADEQLLFHIKAIAALFYKEIPPEQLQSLEDIEETVRQQVIERVSGEIGNFFIEAKTGTTAGRTRILKSIIGNLKITEKQAKKLQVKKNAKISPYLEKCCLLLSANESFSRAEQDIIILTGMAVGHSVQQRLVQRQEFELPSISLDEVSPGSPKSTTEETPGASRTTPEISKSNKKIEEISIDGGKVRLRTPKGQPCEWRDYKAVNLHSHSVEAFFRENEKLVKWVNRQPFSKPIICLGDGHDGIWNLFSQISSETQRCEILDWYHLIENLYKVGGSIKRLKKAEAFLWMGDVESAIALFKGWDNKEVDNFIVYLNKHRHRIVNYYYFQTEGISIGSGSIESTIKQIGRRVKISGAQWKRENVPKVLRLRCAYINGEFSNFNHSSLKT